MRLILPLLTVLLAAAPATAEPVALTFDDLPIFGKTRPIAEARDLTARLLGGLKRHHFTATGFVNESELETPDKPERIALLSMWLDAGMDLGNHGYSHLSLNRTPVDAYIADAAKGTVETSKLLAARGRTELWYRHPYLETGATAASKAAFEAWLTAHGYRIAPVSMENSDWLFGMPYDDALKRGDAAHAAYIRKAYLDYTARIVPWYRQAAVGVLGRRPAFVFLLHASRLNADTIDDLAAIFAKNHLTPTTLDRALRDRAYRIPDTYVGPDGNNWLTRWAITLHKPMPWSKLPTRPADIAAESAKLG